MIWIPWISCVRECRQSRDSARKKRASGTPGGTRLSFQLTATLSPRGGPPARFYPLRGSRRLEGLPPFHTRLISGRIPHRSVRSESATVSAVTRAKRGKTGSERDCRAAHGAARVADGVVESPFFHGVEPRAPNVHACTLGWESERGSECTLRCHLSLIIYFFFAIDLR
jgi:hypothetical protein